MKWKPITEDKIIEMLNDAWDRMSIEQQRLWKIIKRYPEKWKLPPWGDLGGGFWVVGIYGNTVIYYNDIEHGFNRATYKVFGKIENYYCNQDELEWTIQHIINEIRDGYFSGYTAGPPQP